MIKKKVILIFMLTTIFSCSNMKPNRNVASDTTGNPLLTESGLTIKHPTCNIYLPINERLEGWGSNKNLLVAKGYNPIEINVKDDTTIEKGSLVAEINYNFHKKTSFFKRNNCSVQLEIGKLEGYSSEGDAILVNYYSAKEEQFSRTKAIKCTKSENLVFENIPRCEIK